MSKVRHVLGISGGKDSAALAIYMRQRHPELDIEYYNSDTGCELEDTIRLVDNLESYLERKIVRLIAAQGSPEPTPFDHFLKTNGGYLPSPQARWCTQKLKLAEFEKYVGDDPAISYVGIRGDEEREGYVSTKPNIQAIFPFRKNIWSLDVINKVLHKDNMKVISELYDKFTSDEIKVPALEIVNTPLTRGYYYSKKLNALHNVSVKAFNNVVFKFLKTTDYPVGKLDEFPLINNEDVLVKADIFRLLEESGVGVPRYYKPIEFEVDGQKGEYFRSRSGCYFCFFQQRIEWIWLLEQYPTLFEKAKEYEKDGYTWIQGETLSELAMPERVRRIKLDYLKKQESFKMNNKSSLLIDMFDVDETNCANCFI